MNATDISASLITTEYRGDHSAEVRIAIRVQENETVTAFMERVSAYKHREFNAAHDHVELRFTQAFALDQPISVKP